MNHFKCKNFLQDVFCGEVCLKKAMSTYHERESSLLESLEAANVTQTEWNVALRAILSKPLSFFLENRKDFFTNQDLKYGTNMAEGQVFDSDDYKSVFNLQSSVASLPLPRLHFMAFVASFYLTCLRRAEYFKNTPESPQLSRDEAFMLKLLLHFMSVSNVNAHEIGLYEANAENLMGGSIIPVGGSLSPAMVLLNHSCDPNTIRFYHSGATIAMANRTILEGEEVQLHRNFVLVNHATFLP